MSVLVIRDISTCLWLMWDKIWMVSDFSDTCPVYQRGGGEYEEMGRSSDMLIGALVGRRGTMPPCAWTFWQFTWERKLGFLQPWGENPAVSTQYSDDVPSFAWIPGKTTGSRGISPLLEGYFSSVSGWVMDGNSHVGLVLTCKKDESAGVSSRPY